jgi:hypothetical protein
MARGWDLRDESEQQRDAVSRVEKDSLNGSLVLVGKRLFFFLPSNTLPKPPSPRHYVKPMRYFLVEIVMLLNFGLDMVDEDLFSNHEL